MSRCDPNPAGRLAPTVAKSKARCGGDFHPRFHRFTSLMKLSRARRSLGVAEKKNTLRRRFLKSVTCQATWPEPRSSGRTSRPMDSSSRCVSRVRLFRDIGQRPLFRSTMPWSMPSKAVMTRTSFACQSAIAARIAASCPSPHGRGTAFNRSK